MEVETSDTYANAQEMFCSFIKHLSKIAFHQNALLPHLGFTKCPSVNLSKKFKIHWFYPFDLQNITLDYVLIEHLISYFIFRD